MNNQLLYDKWKIYQFYVIAGVVSAIMLFFVPMVGSDFSVELAFPNTIGGWIVYITSKLLAVALNLVIFHCFICQAKTNVRENKKFLEANEILLKTEQYKDLEPRSPKKFFGQVYGRKGTTLAISTLAAALTLSQAVLAFDFTTFLTHVFTLLFGLGAGIFQMNQVEDFWTGEYWYYAKKVEQDMELAQKALSEQNDDSSNSDRGADVLVSIDSNSNLSTDN